MRTWTIALVLCAFCFVLPIQCFIIGNYLGVGIQGAVFRYQITGQGNSLIPIVKEITYVTSGTYTGKTAVSVIFWVLGTLFLILITLISLNFWNQLNTPQVRIITIGLLCSGICYIVSCISQYGLLFSGPAGISLPFGVILLIIYAILLRFYGPFLFDIDEDVSKTDQISY